MRVLGCDTPEIHSKNEGEKKLALKAKDFTDTFCGGKIVQLRDHGKDKYGRMMARVVVDENCLTEKLIEAGLARAYDGGKKKGW